MPIFAPVDRPDDECSASSVPEAAELEAAVSAVVDGSVLCETLELEVEDEAGVVYPLERLVTMVPVGTLTTLLAAQSQSVLYPRQQYGDVPSWTPPGHDFMPLPVVAGKGVS